MNLSLKLILLLAALSVAGSAFCEDKTYLLGRFEPSKDPRFVRVSREYTGLPDAYLRSEAYEAFRNMAAAARKDGVDLKILSATRNFSQQEAIWDGKWEGRISVNGKNLAKSIPDPLRRANQILLYSSMPGTSRHHWGSDMDLNSLNNAYFNHGKGKKTYNWLTKNASGFGFSQPYTKIGGNRPFGYQEEKWHWSYVPLSKKFLTEYTNQIGITDITGFDGSVTAGRIGIIEKYVLGINQECK